MKNILEGLLKSKTAWFNVVMGLIALASALGLFGADAAPTPEQVQGAFDAVDAAIAAVWAVGGVILRAMTKEPVQAKVAAKGP